MPRTIATNRAVDLAELIAFVRPRHQFLLSTVRADGRPQLSPVTGGIDDEGHLLISSYPGRAKSKNAAERPQVSVCVLSDEFGGAWVQVDGTAEVIGMPEAADGLVDYFRVISGEHSDWDEYREAMQVQDKVLIKITPTRWGPIATGGFPAEVAARLDG